MQFRYGGLHIVISRSHDTQTIGGPLPSSRSCAGITFSRGTIIEFSCGIVEVVLLENVPDQSHLGLGIAADGAIVTNTPSTAVMAMPQIVHRVDSVLQIVAVERRRCHFLAHLNASLFSFRLQCARMVDDRLRWHRNRRTQ